MDAIYEMIEKIQYFSSFLVFLLSIFFGSAFMEASQKKKYNAITIIFAFVLAVIMNMLFWKYKDVLINDRDNAVVIHNYGKNFFFIALCMLIQWIYFRRKFFLTIVSTIIYTEILMVAEFAVKFLLSNVSMVLYQEKIAIYLWTIVVITLMTLLLHGIVPKNEISTLYLFVVCLITLTAILCNWLMFGGGERIIALPEGYIDYFGEILFCGFLLFQIMAVFLVLKIAETHQQKQANSLIELNNKMLQRSIDETEQTFELWRQSVHDYKNHVIVLKHLADENRLDEIKTFLNEEEDTISKQLFMIRTGNSVVDTLVNIKRSLAEKHHIVFVVHGTLPSKLIVADMDLANILGNLLDNAIEASQKETEPYIELIMKQEKNFFILNIRNKCTESSKKELGKTSKENPEFHGIGLKSVTRIVKKYDGEMIMEQNKQEYIVNIMIQNKQE